MTCNFFSKLNDIKQLLNEGLSFKECLIRFKNIFASLSSDINLGKFNIELNGVNVFETIYTDYSSDAFELTNVIENDILTFRYFSYENCEFNELELEMIKLVNEFICVLYSKAKLIEFKESASVDMLKKYVDQLKYNDMLQQYAIIYMDLNNYRYINENIGEVKTNKILNLYCDKVSKIIENDERIVKIDSSVFIALIRKNNVDEFIRKKDSIDFFKEFYDIVECFDIRCGIYDVQGTEDFETALDKASIALHVAKDVYKVKNLFYNEEFKNQMIKSQKILTVFPKALSDGEFVVYYQPKINLENSSLCGAEALVRWVRNNEIISPAEFIPVLETENVLYKLDFYILRHVCQDIRKWLDEGKNPLKISVNFSKRSLNNPAFTSDILNILSEYKIEPNFIEIELTETADALDSDDIIKFVETMQKNNINVSIDDFGTGTSSFALVKSLAANTIKIDKSFIDFIQNKEESIIVKNMISLALELGIEVIAEGVETKEQVDILYAMGCNKIQGYYFDRPLPKGEFEKRLGNDVYTKIMRLEQQK